MSNPSADKRVLVVDDDPGHLKYITKGLTRRGLTITATDDGKSAMQILRDQTFDAVVCDLMMPEIDGLDVLRFASTLNPSPPFIMITAQGSVQVAVEAMKQSAADFLEKPISINELDAAVKGVLSRRSAPSRTPARLEKAKSNLVGSDEWLDPFLQTLNRVAQSDVTVLIEGETGTGKSAFAKELWRRSSRSRGPFVGLNCAAIPAELLENELFGHVKGAFTGAAGQVGKVQQAEGGTLFLDEIGELSFGLQAKLLHLLHEKTYSPVGSTSTRKANVRFIAATNRDLLKEVEAGTFREDLFFRLNVVNLTIPPLRNRPADIPILLRHFQANCARDLGTQAFELAQETSDALLRYEWPGNVRELENLVQRATVMHGGSGPMRIADLPDRIQHATAAIPPHSSIPVISVGTDNQAPPTTTAITVPDLPQLDGRSLADVVRDYEWTLIEQALQKTSGNRTKAAKLLGTRRTTLIEKIRRHQEIIEKAEPALAVVANSLSQPS